MKEMQELEKQILFTSDYVCDECGERYGKPRGGVTTCHESKCGVCGQTRTVCHQRNYGWFLEDKEKFVFKEEK